MREKDVDILPKKFRLPDWLIGGKKARVQLKASKTLPMSPVVTSRHQSAEVARRLLTRRRYSAFPLAVFIFTVASVPIVAAAAQLRDDSLRAHWDRVGGHIRCSVASPRIVNCTVDVERVEPECYWPPLFTCFSTWSLRDGTGEQGSADGYRSTIQLDRVACGGRSAPVRNFDVRFWNNFGYGHRENEDLLVVKAVPELCREEMDVSPRQIDAREDVLGELAERDRILTLRVNPGSISDRESVEFKAHPVGQPLVECGKYHQSLGLDHDGEWHGQLAWAGILRRAGPCGLDGHPGDFLGRIDIDVGAATHPTAHSADAPSTNSQITVRRSPWRSVLVACTVAVICLLIAITIRLVRVQAARDKWVGVAARQLELPRIRASVHAYRVRTVVGLRDVASGQTAPRGVFAAGCYSSSPSGRAMSTMRAPFAERLARLGMRSAVEQAARALKNSQTLSPSSDAAELIRDAREACESEMFPSNWPHHVRILAEELARVQNSAIGDSSEQKQLSRALRLLERQYQTARGQTVYEQGDPSIWGWAAAVLLTLVALVAVYLDAFETGGTWSSAIGFGALPFSLVISYELYRRLKT